ncbi:DEAD/DEAH box helicase [Candidatus Oscillochloris fontis]|uniref:DEAD/DEAH box helicase n=1 Tax=Candidatus Oscillochloris fontis TaxID=2496868 RepID=UPI0019310C59|nr:DEAD/DEAH box helicase [Candidatus Oscillochloris fontis]
MTIILHGTWLPQVKRLFIWGEDSQLLGRGVRKAKTPIHPFHAAIADLQRMIVHLVGQAESAEQIIWLPSVAGRPAPLRELRNTGIEAAEGDASLAAWRVRGLIFDTQTATDLLLKLEESDILGSDLLAWRVAARLVAELVVGEQFLPTLERDGSLLRAHWRPRPLATTARSLTRLASSLPPLCRAIVTDHAQAMSAHALLDDFVSVCVDRLVRDLAREQDATVATIGRWQRQIGAAGAAWLAALFSDEQMVHLKHHEADELFRAWRIWYEQDHAAGDDQFRITFRLEEPNTTQPNQTDWTLRFLLQATDDPSLLVPVGQLWQERGVMFQYLDRRFAHPQERLLRGLGFAARLVGAIERSLRTKTPEYATLSAEEAFGFLSEAGPLLEQSGFGVLVPAFWGGARRLRVRANATKRTSKRADHAGRLSFANMIDFKWQLSIGDQQIELAEFERLVALKQPLVQIRGEWVALDPEHARQTLALLKKGSRMNLGEALRLGLTGTAPQLPAGLAFDGFDTDGDIGALLDDLGRIQQLTELPQPTNFHGTLRPYQVRGFSWLVFLRRFGLGACLADDMGLGKSPQTIALLLHEKAQMPSGPPSLLVCPTSVVGNWERELLRFAPSLRILVHQGSDRKRGTELSQNLSQCDVVITSFPLLARDRDDLTLIEWRLAILDEAQNIKNSDTRQAQAARALQAEARIALTGTPVENRLTELWSIMTFLNPGYLGGETEFRRTFAKPIEMTNDQQATETLRRLTAPFILRRLKTDKSIISDLPDKIEMKVYVPLSREQVTLYEATVRDALAQIEQSALTSEPTKRRGMVLSMLTKLKQICNHPVNFLKDRSPINDRSGKLERMGEMVEELLTVGDRALIFTQFTEMGDLLEQYLSERFATRPLFLHGSTPPKERDAMVRRFQAPKGPPIFILSLKAGGVGLNLTHANHVFHYDRWWNPAVEDQATDRAFRIGQQRNVQVHKFLCGGTLEEKIDDMIESKRGLSSLVLGSGETWLTELTTNQLRELVALRRDAVAE